MTSGHEGSDGAPHTAGAGQTGVKLTPWFAPKKRFAQPHPRGLEEGSGLKRLPFVPAPFCKPELDAPYSGNFLEPHTEIDASHELTYVDIANFLANH